MFFTLKKKKMTFLEYLLSFSESEYNNKPGKLTIMGLSIWIASWRKFPANCLREKREKAALRFADLPPPEMPWMFQEVQTWYFPLWHLPTPPLYFHGCSGHSPPSSSHAWDMPIWGGKSNNHSMGLVFKSALSRFFKIYFYILIWMEACNMNGRHYGAELYLYCLVFPFTQQMGIPLMWLSEPFCVWYYGGRRGRGSKRGGWCCAAQDWMPTLMPPGCGIVKRFIPIPQPGSCPMKLRRPLP